MKIKSILILSAILGLTRCADNTLDVVPEDSTFPYQLILDAEEGSDLADAEDYDLEVKFADYLPGMGLPSGSITLSYEFKDAEGSFEGVTIYKIVYEVEKDDCVFERELEFTQDGAAGTIILATDPDLKSVPGSFEIVFVLPGEDDTEGGFRFEITEVSGSNNVTLGYPREFEYEVLDGDVAGEWELEITSEEEFEMFKKIFGSLNADLAELSFEDITGKIKAEFEFEEAKFVVELVETEEVTECKDGESETEVVNLEIEIEAEYDAEDGELVFEGGHIILGDDGEPEGELDFMIESEYETNADDETLKIRFVKVVDEDHYEEGDELFNEEEGITFIFKKD